MSQCERTEFWELFNLIHLQKHLFIKHFDLSWLNLSFWRWIQKPLYWEFNLNQITNSCC